MRIITLIRAFLAGIAGCLSLLYPSITPLAGPLDELQVISAKRLCEEKGQLLVTQKSDPVTGYFLSKELVKDLGFGFYEIARELLEKRYTFFEIDQDTWKDPRSGRVYPHAWGNTMFSHAIGSGTKYYRFSLTEQGASTCAAFNEEIQHYPSQKLPALRSWGLPTNLCIAAEKTNDLQSRYQKLVERTRTPHALGSYDWSAHYSIHDRETETTVVEVTTNGYDPGRKGHGFTCPNKDQIALFQKTLHGISDPRLLEPNVPIVIDEPAPFPASKELDAKLLLEEKSTEHLTEYTFLEFLHPIALDGRIFFSPRYRSSASGTSLTGYYLEIIGAGTTNRIFVKAFDSRYSDFQALQVLNNGDIIFLGYPILSPIKERIVTVFRYSSDGTPLNSYKVILPALEIPGDVRPLIDNLKINTDVIELSIKAYERDHHGMQALRRYTFRAPLKSAS